MNNTPAKSVSEKIFDLIRRQNGKLGWHEIAAGVGADAFAERGEIFVQLRRSNAVESFVASTAKGTRDIGSCDREIAKVSSAVWRRR